MNKRQKYIDALVEKILNEEITKKAKDKSKMLAEEFGDGRDEIDVARPKGKITAADFKKLRSGKKKEVDEYYYDDNENIGDESTSNEFAGDEPKWSVERNPKMIGSFDDEHGWFDELDYPSKHDAFSDYDEEEFDEFDPFYEKYGKEQRWFGPGKEGKRFFDLYKDKYQKPFKVRRPKSMEEAETEEGNEFSGARQDAIDAGKKEFEVDGKTYPVKESTCKSCGKKKKNTLKLTEEELIDLIEKIVKEEQTKTKDNIKKQNSVGLRQTEKVLDKNKKENQESTNATSKKMKDYLKDGSKGKYETEPKEFPKGNGEMGEMKKKAYKASEAVEEYIESFAYPGMENNHYDEIKPNEEWLENNIKGSSKTGNNPKWANAVETELGEKINDKRKKNLFDKEKQRSYNRVTQPVDSAGESDGESSLDKMFMKLESTENKKEKVISEEMSRMKKLISYSKKTQ